MVKKARDLIQVHHYVARQVLFRHSSELKHACDLFLDERRSEPRDIAGGSIQQLLQNLPVYSPQLTINIGSDMSRSDTLRFYLFCWHLSRRINLCLITTFGLTSLEPIGVFRTYQPTTRGEFAKRKLPTIEYRAESALR